MTNLGLLATRIAAVLKKRGIRGVWRSVCSDIARLYRNRRPDPFDAEQGTETGGWLPVWRFSNHGENIRFASQYETTHPNDIAEAIRALPSDIAGFTFIDIGCGKGRALLVAADWPFERLIGVEFVEELAATARKNLAKRQIANAKVIATDVAGFAFPDGDLVVYMFNPFQEPVMRKVVDSLERDRLGRLYIIYVNPLHDHVIEHSGCFERIATVTGCEYPTMIWQRRPVK